MTTAQKNGTLDGYEMERIREFTAQILSYVAKGNKEVEGKVETIMGGKVLDMQVDKIIRVERLLQETNEELRETQEEMRRKNDEIQRKDSKLKEKDSKLKEKDSKLREKDNKLKEKDNKLEEIQRISIRNLLDDYAKAGPINHKTIQKISERYPFDLEIIKEEVERRMGS